MSPVFSGEIRGFFANSTVGTTLETGSSTSWDAIVPGRQLHLFYVGAIIGHQVKHAPSREIIFCSQLWVPKHVLLFAVVGSNTCVFGMWVRLLQTRGDSVVAATAARAQLDQEPSLKHLGPAVAKARERPGQQDCTS